MLNWLKKLTGDSTARTLDAIAPLVDEIVSLQDEIRALSDEEIRERSLALREEVQNDADVAAARQTVVDKRAELETEPDPDHRMALRDAWQRAQRDLFQAEQQLLDAILPAAFALVREGARRAIGQFHFQESQLWGGIVLHQGKIAEMKTGEGKTLTATLPLYLNALAGHGAHLVTVNDYLARRDCGWMGEIFYFLGLSTAVVIPDFSGIYDPTYITEQVQGHDERLMHLRPCTRQEAYQADITYGTNSELGFDYLRDNMAHELVDIVQRERYYAIVDEVDNILIDEARTPLIISAPDEESFKQYIRFARVVNALGPGDHEIEEKDRVVTLTDQGVDRVEKLLNIDRERGESLYDADHAELTYYLEAALKARFLYRKDKDYVVREGQVIIVDEFTGRMMPGRRWSDGIHESIEAKEHEVYREKVEIQRESKTFATVTLQNYFRIYQKLAGMSGTAATEQEEFFKIYGLDVVVVPTYRPLAREDAADRIYAREEAKLRAVVREILQNYCLGRPVLVGTTSVATSERLAGYLDRKYIALAVLMPMLARALREADLGGDARRAMPEIFGEPLERFGLPFQNLARAAALAPNTLRDDTVGRAAEQVERMLDAQESRLRREQGSNGEQEEAADREALRERKRQRSGEREALHQALQEGTQGAFDQVIAMLDLHTEEEVARLRRALDEGIVEAQVLNAKQHEREALVIAKAGQKHAVTIATNMAGRGVDIILGGDPTQRAYERLEPFLLDKDRSVGRIVEALLGSPSAEAGLPRARGYLPSALIEHLQGSDGASGVDTYLRPLLGWMWRLVAESQELKERLKEVPLPRLLMERITPRYPDVEQERLGELVTLIDKAARGKPFERPELKAWAGERGLGDLVDEAVGQVRRLFRTEPYVGLFRLQTEFMARYGLQPKLAKELADRILREGQVPTRPYIFGQAQDASIPRYVVEGSWQEYEYLSGVGLPEQQREILAGQLYTSYMNGLTSLLRAALGGNSARAEALVAAMPALPAFFVPELEQVRQECERDREQVRTMGGLRITGTERHEARRIDNQLRGRSGRLGDPGYTQFHVSTEDELMRRFGPGADNMRRTIERFNPDEETPIEARVLTGMMEQAQVRVEGYHFDIRKHLVSYDDVLSRQREVVYAERRRILEADDIDGLVLAQLHEEMAERAEEVFEPLRSRREYDRDSEVVLEALGELLEGIQTGRHGRDTGRTPLFPIISYILVTGLRQDPAMEVLSRLEELHGRVRQGEVVSEDVPTALSELASLAREAGQERAAADLERSGPDDIAAHLVTWRGVAEDSLRAGLAEFIETMLLQNQERFEASVAQSIARYFEEDGVDERGLHLTLLYRELTKGGGIYLPPSVTTARWMGMSPEEITAEVLEAVRKQTTDDLPRSRQRVMERVDRAMRDWSLGGHDWLVVEKLLGELRLPPRLAAEPLMDLFQGDIRAFQGAVVEELYGLAQSFLEDRGQRLGDELLHEVERRYLLEAMDREWIDYLTAMEELRQGIGLRAYGQQDPLTEYRRESYNLFERLMQRVRGRALFYIYASVQVPVSQRAPAHEERRVEGEKPAGREASGRPAAGAAPGAPGAAGKKHRKRKRKSTTTR
jgi:preprotein translocase subunit SecA